MPDQMQSVLTPDQILKRKQRDLAMLGMISGDEVLGGVGKALFKEGSTAGRKAKVNLGEGLWYDPNIDEVTDIPDYTERRTARLEEVEENRRVRPDYSTQPTAGGLQVIQGNPNAENFGPGEMIPVTPRPGAGDVSKANQYQRLAQNAANLALEFQTETGKGAVGPIADPLLSAVGEVPFVGDLLKTTGERAAYNPEERVLRSKGKLMEQELSMIAAGMNVTGFELEARKNWSPFAPGLTAEDRVNRLKSLQTNLFSKAASFSGQQNQTQGGESWVQDSEGNWVME